MNRRGFLGVILAAGAAPAIVKASSLMPVFVRREASGLLVSEAVVGGNTILTIDIITKEALRILHKNMAFMKTVNLNYDHSKLGDRLIVRIPRKFQSA